jgi:hypothetical protein
MSLQRLLATVTLVLRVWVVTTQADESLQIWTNNYLLANAEQKLEPCRCAVHERDCCTTSILYYVVRQAFMHKPAHEPHQEAMSSCLLLQCQQVP